MYIYACMYRDSPQSNVMAKRMAFVATGMVFAAASNGSSTILRLEISIIY